MGSRIRELLNALTMKKDHSVLTPVHIAIALALSIGFIDLAVDMVSGQAGGVALPTIIASLTVTVGLFFLLYLVIWFAVASRIGRYFKLDDMVLAISFALFIGVVFLFGSIYGLITFTPSKADLPKLFMVLVLSSLFLVLTYFAIRAVSEIPGYSKGAVVLGLTIPFLIAEYAIISHVFAGSFMSFIVFLVCACITILLFYRLGQTMRVRMLIAVFCVIPVLAILMAMVPTGTTESKQGFHLTEHGVKRVILVTVDALRADFVSAIDKGNTPTPHMDSLAGDGIVFTSVISPAPWTLPSLSSLMTGISPDVHLTKKAASKLPDRLQTLAEYLRDSGYTTGAIVFNPYLKRTHNLSKGFIHYDVYPKTLIGNSLGARILKKIFTRRFRELATTDDLTDSAIEWLKLNKNKDYFLWVHYLDPHAPYAPPGEFLPKGKAPATIGTSFDRSSDIRDGKFTPSQYEREWIRGLYGGEVLYVDKNIGRLFDTLKQLAMYDDSLIILTADHGEEFWEHGGVDHGHTLYNELLRVPLIIKLPSSSFKGRINTPVSTHSIMPTILDVCSIKYDSEHLSVAALSPLLGKNPGSFDQRPVISSATLRYEDREALFYNGLKYIHSSISGREELYDPARDPQEQFNIANVNPGMIDKARDIMKGYHAAAKQLREHYQIETGAEIQLDQKTLQELKSLGYVK